MLQFGNRSDVCELTARKISREEKRDIMAVRRELRGKLEGKKVVKIRHSGADLVISLEMIHALAKEFPLEVPEVTEETLDGTK